MGWLGRLLCRVFDPEQAAPARPPAPFLPARRHDPAPDIELGFRDGESLTLPGDSPLARALRAVADEISGGRGTGQAS